MNSAQIRDLLNLSRHINARRLWNLLLLEGSFRWSRWRKKARHKGQAFAVSIEPTTSCNLGCPQCPSGLKQFHRPTGNLKPESFDLMLENLPPECFYLTFYFQGEPLRNSDFPAMVKKAKAKRLYTATSSNAHYLHDSMARQVVESGLDKIIISLDGLDQETYVKYRKGGDVQRVFEGIENLVKWKKQLRSHTPFIELQFIVFGHNQHQLEEVKLKAKQLGVDSLSLKSAQIYSYEDEDNLLSSIEKFNRYKKNSKNELEIKSSLPNWCKRMWTSCVICWDGRVVPCCFDKDGDHQLGDLTTDKLSDIWKGKDYQLFREQVFKNREGIEICRNCSEGLK